MAVGMHFCGTAIVERLPMLIKNKTKSKIRHLEQKGGCSREVTICGGLTFTHPRRPYSIVWDKIWFSQLE